MSLLDAWDVDDSALPEEPGIDDREIDVTGGYVSVGLKPKPEEEEPIFALDSQYKPNGMVHMDVSNEIVVMGLKNGHVMRLDLNRPQELEDIEIFKKKDPLDAIHKVFVSPDGQHQIISLDNGENYYMHFAWRDLKARQLAKFKNLVIESIGWNKRNTSTDTTKEFLIGTRSGAIYEAVLEPKDKGQKVEERTMKLVFQFADKQPVTGIELEQFTNGASYFVMATSPTKIYQFSGGPTFEQMFANEQRCFELPGTLSYSQLRFYTKPDAYMPTSFAWLTGTGVYFGSLNFREGENVMSDCNLITYSSLATTRKESSRGGRASMMEDAIPISLGITEFHILLVYEHKFQAICRLNEEVVYEQDFPPGAGRVLGITQDTVKNAMWVFSDSNVFEVVITREDRNVWALYLERGIFDKALTYCKNPQQRDKVLLAQADYYYEQSVYDVAAAVYAKTQKAPFEEICLKFINNNQRDALKTYLHHKLQFLPKEDMTQRTVICTWLTELMLCKLNELESEGPADEKAHREEFRDFLKQYEKSLNPATTFNLISSHGRVEEMLFYAEEVEKDYERVITHYIQKKDYERAIQVLERQSNQDLYYKFSPKLMYHAPVLLVDSWMRKRERLDPKKLIPALTRYEPSGRGENHAIRYLRFCWRVLGNSDPAIHNYLLSLYAHEANDEQLLSYLDSEDAHFDPKYALRLCTKLGKLKACVHIYSAMNLYEEAVDLALKVDIGLAELNADRPGEDDPALRKKLWLRIAKHVVEQQRDIKRVISFLKKKDGEKPVLKIEDVLPFFPDFTLIDDFKDEICGALQDYNTEIDELKVEMDEATKAADQIRTDIKDLRNRYGHVDARQKCDLCGVAVLSREFYLFPCQHTFHVDCFRDSVMDAFPPPTQRRIADLEYRVAEAKSELPRAQGGAGGKLGQAELEVPQYEQLRAELDELVASQCIYCGEGMIDSVDKPFVSDNDLIELERWRV